MRQRRGWVLSQKQKIGSKRKHRHCSTLGTFLQLSWKSEDYKWNKRTCDKQLLLKTKTEHSILLWTQVKGKWQHKRDRDGGISPLTALKEKGSLQMIFIIRECWKPWMAGKVPWDSSLIHLLLSEKNIFLAKLSIY